MNYLPLCPDVAAPTYAWVSKHERASKEVAFLAESVRRLEQASREQLLLENESQGHVAGDRTHGLTMC
jgi:hypothetical protein